MQISENKEKGKVLQSQLLLQLEGIDHFSSTKATLHAEDGIWMPRQVHGTCIAEIRKEQDAPTDIPEADAVISNRVGLWIGVRTADCVPVLLYDPQQNVVAAVHAGWRGTVAHIVQKTIQRLKAEYGCMPENLYAMIGPSISPECFEVGTEVAEEFKKAGRGECISSAPLPGRKPHIDLWQSNVMDMLEKGLDLGHIDCTPLCTFQNTDILYSARQEGISTGRIVSAIRLK